MLVPADENKEMLKKYEELWNKIRDDCDERYMKIKFNLDDDDSPSRKTLDFCNVVIVVRSVFHEGKKYYPQVFSDKCLYKS